MNASDCGQPLLFALPLVALIGAALSYLIGQWKEGWSGIAATAAVGLCFGISFYLWQQLSLCPFLEHQAFEWLATGDLVVNFTLRFDRLTAIMALVVLGVGFLIHLYSVGYMAKDPARPRFFAFLNLFIATMLLLILAGNFLVLFVGWEGVGLCSYLLIGFWHKKSNNAAAGRKAFIVNRIGDAGFLLGIFLVFVFLGSLDFQELAELLSLSSHQFEVFTLIALCLFVGAVGKSAQLPLMVWLPDAMVGPTPVSALIHAATMVTAGVYMVVRLHFIFSLAPLAMAVMCWIGVLTAFLAAAIALTQNDLKRVLAYSTISQLGLMFVAAALGSYVAAIFHLVTHAVFKSTLFLTAGSVIASCQHQQNQNQMGGLRKAMPLTCICFVLAGLALAGIFPLSGYYSKHVIFLAFGQNENHYLLRHIFTLKMFLTLTTIMTGFYIARLFVAVFLGKYRGIGTPVEVPRVFLLPQITLAILSALLGLMLVAFYDLQGYLAAGLGIEFVNGSPSTVFAGLLHSWPGLLGLAIACFLYSRAPQWPGRIFAGSAGIGVLLRERILLDQGYGWLIVRPLRRVAKFLWKSVDVGVVDGAVNGIAAVLELNGEVLRQLQTGQLRHYAFFMMLALAVIWGLYLSL